jgi:riboflavin kinase
MSEVAAESSPPVQAPIKNDVYRATRPLVVGPDAPEPPFPVWMFGAVQRGFGRGGKDLGCPTGQKYFAS